jgi:hypothetical protein
MIGSKGSVKMHRAHIRKSFVFVCLAASLVGGCSRSGGDAAVVLSSECHDQLTAGAALGITAVPEQFAESYGRLFCKYSQVLAPNGDPIRLFAQREISNEQMLYARGVLEFYLEPVPGSRHGADKTAIADKMAENGATLLLLKGYDGEFEIFEDEAIWREIDGQPLYEDEIAAPGSTWYIDNIFDGHRDATFEEILHLVHDNGIGIDVDWMPPGVAPEFQREIREAEINALETNGLWAQGERTADWIAELRDEGSLTQEYLASVVDSYYGLWGAFEEREGGMWGIYVAKTRNEIAEKDPMGLALMESFFNPYLTFDARLDPSFDGVFTMTFDPEIPYTHKSQYLVRATLTGANDSGLEGNDQDNTLTGNSGANLLDGGDGTDTAVFEGTMAEYEISRDGDLFIVNDTIEGRDGRDRLQAVEQLQFRDGLRSTDDLDSSS